MIKNIALFVSSLTGNTEKIAHGIYTHLLQNDYSVTMQDSCIIKNDLLSADLNILCFWCRRASLDDDTKKLLRRYLDTPFLAIGTCGHYPDSEYGQKIKKQVSDYINQSNCCIDVFLSQGAVLLDSTEYRRKLPQNHPHYLDDSGYARHIESQNHPNEADIQNAIHFVSKYLSNDHSIQ